MHSRLLLLTSVTCLALSQEQNKLNGVSVTSTSLTSGCLLLYVGEVLLFKRESELKETLKKWSCKKTASQAIFFSSQVADRKCYVSFGLYRCASVEVFQGKIPCFLM